MEHFSKRAETYFRIWKIEKGGGIKKKTRKSGGTSLWGAEKGKKEESG